jgi:hypothetical protein
MFMKTTITVLVLVLATTAAASEVEPSRRGTVIAANYSLATPLGATRSFASDGSAQGLGGDVIWGGDRFRVGLGVSWQIFREERQAPGTSSGAQYENRTVSLVPVLASGYYLWRHGSLRTFLGAGVGGMMSHRKFEAQAEETRDKTWYVSASGFAGALIELTPGFGLETRLRYVGGFKKDVEAIGMVQWTLGIIYIY